MNYKLLRIKELTEKMILSHEVCCGSGEFFTDFQHFDKLCRDDEAYKKEFELHDLICELLKEGDAK